MSIASVHPKAVVVTRDEPANGPLSTGLRELGLRVLAWPVIKISPPADVAALERALASAGDYDWITFASQHAVAAVTSRLRSVALGAASASLEPAVPREPDVRPHPRLDERLDLQPSVQPDLRSDLQKAGQSTVLQRQTRIAAVGKRTAEALEEQGWRVDLVPKEETAEGLVNAMAPTLRAGAKVLFPASSRALPTLAAGLRKLGAIVVEVEAYRTEAASLDIDGCRSLIDAEAVGAVTFTRPSAVTELDQALGEMHFDRLLSYSAIVALGPTTGRALIDRGHQPVLADPQTLQGLAVTTARLLQTRP